MDGGPGAGERMRAFGAAVVRGARMTGRFAIRTGGVTRDAAKATGRAAQATGRFARRATHAQGAGRTGLAGVIELSALHSAADALVTVALAGTLLFGLPVGEARGQVALYLVITMVPFAVVAPFVGPLLDRMRSGRRFVIAGTLLARGLLCWGMASAVVSEDVLTLFPAAFAVLVLSKAYNVSRAAIMPTVLPADITLVTANARVQLAALLAAGVAAPFAAGMAVLVGPEWVLRTAMVVFIGSVAFAVRLPRHVDSPDDDPTEPVSASSPAAKRWRTLFSVGPVVAEAIRANAAIRFFSGFLVLFLMFLIMEKHLPGLDPKLTKNPVDPKVALGVLAVAAGVGGLLGTAVGSWVRSHAPHLIVLATLGISTISAGVAAAMFGLWAAGLVALVAAFAQALGKLALDAIVQREIGEEVRSSTFGVSEALLQLAWVFGGLIGLWFSVLSGGTPGLVIVAVVLLVSLFWLLVQRFRRRRARVRLALESHGRRPAPGPRSPSPVAPGPASHHPRPTFGNPGPHATKPYTRPPTS